MATFYEFSTTNKEDLVWDMKKLQEVGRNVDYVDTRKKKPAETSTDTAGKPSEGGSAAQSQTAEPGDATPERETDAGQDKQERGE